MTGDETRKQVEDDAKEDLELQEEDAENVAGGLFIHKAGTEQPDYLKIEPTD